MYKRQLYKSLEANDYIDPTELAAFSYIGVSEDIQKLVDRFVDNIKQFDNLTAIAILRDIESISGFDLSSNEERH